MRIREIARARVRYGYRKIRVLLNREGWNVGKYLVERLYREEGLSLRQRVKRRRRAAEHRRERFHPTAPNQVWSMDFVADQLADGRRFRSLTVMDIYTSECLAIEAAQSLKGEDVVRVMNQIKMHRGVPKMLFCDNGAEFTSQAMDLWSLSERCSHGVLAAREANRQCLCGVVQRDLSSRVFSPHSPYGTLIVPSYITLTHYNYSRYNLLNGVRNGQLQG